MVNGDAQYGGGPSTSGMRQMKPQGARPLMDLHAGTSQPQPPLIDLHIDSKLSHGG